MEATGAATCHLADNFCHQLAAKSTAGKKNRRKKITKKQKGARRGAGRCVRLSLRPPHPHACFPIAPLGQRHPAVDSPRRPRASPPRGEGRLNCLALPSQELWQRCAGCRRSADNSLMRRPGCAGCAVMSAKCKAGAAHAVCYHSICLKPQTGHYPAIILVDLQSRWMKQLLWLVRSPGGEMGTSL